MVSSAPFFIVRHVSDDSMDDLGTRVVGVTEDPQTDCARCFLFQRSLSNYTNEDRRLGMDTYAISNEHGVSAYAPLTSYEVTPRKLMLNFTKDAAKVLGVPQQVTLELTLTDHDMEILISGLREVIRA
jgi:Immunity protein 10